MKKTLRFIVIFVLLAFGIMLVLAIYEPQDIVVTRKTVINAPTAAVFEQMVKFRNWANWNPWYLGDTVNTKLTYSGADGEPGSAYQWKGDEHITGSGEIRNTGVEGTSIHLDIHFTEPVDGIATGQLSAKDSAGMTIATWKLTKHTPFPFNGMCVFLDLDKMLGGDFEAGLANMKKYVESHTPPTPVVDIKEVDFAAHTYEGMRKTVAMSDMLLFFKDTYGVLGKDPTVKISGPATGVFYTWDTVNKSSDMAAVFPVSDTLKPAPGAVILHVGPAKAYMAVEKGGYAGAMIYHTALAKRIAGQGKKQALVIEEYIAGPGNEPDSNKWVTNIYYLVQ